MGLAHQMFQMQVRLHTSLHTLPGQAVRYSGQDNTQCCLEALHSLYRSRMSATAMQCSKILKISQGDSNLALNSILGGPSLTCSLSRLNRCQGCTFTISVSLFVLPAVSTLPCSYLYDTISCNLTDACAVQELSPHIWGPPVDAWEPQL